MDKYTIYNPAIKFKADYEWPEENAKHDCPKCNTPMQLNENDETYFGKPWWCPKCQWQFSEEELVNQD